MIGVLGLQLLHPSAVKRAKARYEEAKEAEARGEQPDPPKSNGTPFVPAVFALGNHHMMKQFAQRLSELGDASAASGQGEAAAFDALSKAMHDVLKGEMDEEALGVFKTLVRQGDPEDAPYWSTEEAQNALVRLGVQPLEADEETKSAPVIRQPRSDKRAELAEDALAAFTKALEEGDE